MDFSKINLTSKPIPYVGINEKEKPKFSFYGWYYKLFNNLFAKINFSWHF